MSQCQHPESGRGNSPPGSRASDAVDAGAPSGHALSGLHQKVRWPYFLEKFSEGFGPGSGRTTRDQYQSPLSAEAPVSGLAFLSFGPEGKRHRRNRRNLVFGIRQRTAGADLGDRLENGAAGTQNGGSSGNWFRFWNPSWPGMRFSARTEEKKAPSPCRLERGAWPMGGAPEQGDQSLGWRLPHPAASATRSRLKEWRRRIHGVATKHLEHYLSWRPMTETFGKLLSFMPWQTLSTCHHERQHDSATQGGRTVFPDSSRALISSRIRPALGGKGPDQGVGRRGGGLPGERLGGSSAEGPGRDRREVKPEGTGRTGTRDRRRRRSPTGPEGFGGVPHSSSSGDRSDR